MVPGMCQDDAQFMTLNTTLKSGVMAIRWFPQFGTFGKAVNYELYLYSVFPVCVSRMATSTLFNHQLVFFKSVILN